jgi:hypothetical protein
LNGDVSERKKKEKNLKNGNGEKNEISISKNVKGKEKVK